MLHHLRSSAVFGFGIALSTLVAAGLGMAPAHAQTACYGPAEYEAEQAIRLQSELTVYAYSCPSVATEQPLPVQLGRFSQRHQTEIRRWQRALTDHLRKTERGRPEALFDRQQSIFANESGFRSGRMSPPVFCAERKAHFDRVMAFTTDELKRHLNDPTVLRLSTRPLCRPLDIPHTEPDEVALNLRTVALP